MLFYYAEEPVSIRFPACFTKLSVTPNKKMHSALFLLLVEMRKAATPKDHGFGRGRRFRSRLFDPISSPGSPSTPVAHNFVIPIFHSAPNFRVFHPDIGINIGMKIPLPSPCHPERKADSPCALAEIFTDIFHRKLKACPR